MAPPLTTRLRSWRAAAPGFVERQTKNLGHVRYAWGHGKQVSFVFGCQRSGTKMLMRILDRSPAVRIYHENHASAFRDFELRSNAVLRALVVASPAPSQIFKPICDSQRADEVLRDFPQAHGLWVYRQFNEMWSRPSSPAISRAGVGAPRGCPARWSRRSAPWRAPT